MARSHRGYAGIWKWAGSTTASYRVVDHAKALLMAGDGVANSRIAARLGISRPTVLKWRSRTTTESTTASRFASG